MTTKNVAAKAAALGATLARFEEKNPDYARNGIAGIKKAEDPAAEAEKLKKLLESDIPAHLKIDGAPPIEPSAATMPVASAAPAAAPREPVLRDNFVQKTLYVPTSLIPMIDELCAHFGANHSQVMTSALYAGVVQGVSAAGLTEPVFKERNLESCSGFQATSGEIRISRAEKERIDRLLAKTAKAKAAK